MNITDAQPGASADLKSREKRYGITMAVRVACFLIAIIWVPRPYMWVLLAAAAVLPYVAVIIANQADERRHKTPRFERGQAANRPELTDAKTAIGSSPASSNGQPATDTDNDEQPSREAPVNADEDTWRGYGSWPDPARGQHD